MDCRRHKTAVSSDERSRDADKYTGRLLGFPERRPHLEEWTESSFPDDDRALR